MLKHPLSMNLPSQLSSVLVATFAMAVGVFSGDLELVSIKVLDRG